MDKDIQLTFKEVLHACNSEPQWVISLIEEAVIDIDGDLRQAMFIVMPIIFRYSVMPPRRAQRISRDFQASPSATALIVELLDELENLRRVL